MKFSKNFSAYVRSIDIQIQQFLPLKVNHNDFVALHSIFGEFSEGLRSYFKWNIIHISKFKPETVAKNSSTIGPLAGIKPMPLRCRCNLEIRHLNPSENFYHCTSFLCAP